VPATETIIITNKLTVTGEANTTHKITGSLRASVGSTKQTVQISSKTITVTENPTNADDESSVDEYDTNKDGIGARDVRDAIDDFLFSDKLSRSEVNKIIDAFLFG
jgi:hypothetical protein